MHPFDAIVIGGGPAGVSCAVWLARLGLNPVLLEASSTLGGLVRENPFEDHWVAVLPGKNGQEMAANLAESAKQAGVTTFFHTKVLKLSKQGGGFVAQTAGPSAAGTYCAKTVVIASGVRARTLPGHSDDMRFPGVLVGPGLHVAEHDYQGLDVAILGGGDNAFENYSYVRGRGARSVHLYARSVRAQAQWIAKAPTVDVHVGPYVVEPASRRINGQQYDRILVFYGWEPRAPFADTLNLARDKKGFFQTDFANAQTSEEGVYAIGEVANRMHPCVVTALADGAVAAKAIQARIEGPVSFKTAL